MTIPLTKPRGAFLLFEGLDRSGKTTQCTKLVDYLRDKGISAEMWRFPDRSTETGKRINEYLKGSDLTAEEAHNLFVANRLEKRDLMRATLAAGTTLVVDRFAHSGVAYSAAKDLPELSISRCMQLDAASCLPAPDLVIYLDASGRSLDTREGYGEERYEDKEFQRKVASKFKELQLHDTRPWQVINADQSIDDIHKKVTDAVDSVLDSATSEPLRTLWSSD